MSFRSFFSATFVLAIAACGSSSEPTAAVPIESTTFASSLGVNLATSTRTPSGMYYRDITVGSGATLTAGQQVGVYYAGALVNGSQFDARQAPSTPFSFKLGSGQVIRGWDEGVAGMKIGGKRQLIIPPALGYGANANGPIPANSVLVFTVEAVSAQ